MIHFTDIRAINEVSKNTLMKFLMVKEDEESVETRKIGKIE